MSRQRRRGRSEPAPSRLSTKSPKPRPRYPSRVEWRRASPKEDRRARPSSSFRAAHPVSANATPTGRATSCRPCSGGKRERRDDCGEACNAFVSEQRACREYVATTTSPATSGPPKRRAERESRRERVAGGKITLSLPSGVDEKATTKRAARLGQVTRMPADRARPSSQYAAASMMRGPRRVVGEVEPREQSSRNGEVLTSQRAGMRSKKARAFAAGESHDDDKGRGKCGEPTPSPV
jgi:hypothetical protein